MATLGAGSLTCWQVQCLRSVQVATVHCSYGCRSVHASQASMCTDLHLLTSPEDSITQRTLLILMPDALASPQLSHPDCRAGRLGLGACWSSPCRLSGGLLNMESPEHSGLFGHTHCRRCARTAEPGHCREGVGADAGRRRAAAARGMALLR